MRAVVLLIDSLGAGELPDAHLYGDKGANTLLHLCQKVKGEKWPNLKKLGLGNLSEINHIPLPGLDPQKEPLASYALMKEFSPGKDTTTGHWELAGIQLEEPFLYFPSQYPSFPESLIQDFLKESGCKGILGNKAASGTRIIEELGKEHMDCGYPICYTSADSVFQIAAHTDIIPLEELYRLCEIARNLLNPMKVGRVIARPFTGEPGNFKRTLDRKDYSLPLPGDSIFDLLKEKGVETIAVGKTGSIYNEQGIQKSYHDKGNDACLERTSSILDEKSSKDQYIFTNLVDTDMIYGHRRDPEGYFHAIDKIDTSIGFIMDKLESDDILIITGDHGCDPTFKGTDHTREYIPLLFFRKNHENGVNLGFRNSFADLSASLLELFGVEKTLKGDSFAGELV